MLKDTPLLHCPDCGAELLPPKRKRQGKPLALAGTINDPNPAQAIPCPLCGQKKTLRDLPGVVRANRRWRFTYGGIL